MKARFSTLILGVAAVSFLTACEQGPQACTAIFAYGLSVQVEDSVSGARLASEVAVTADDGDYHEVLQTVDSVSFFGAGERAGSYTVRVIKDGYAPWEKSGVVVTKDECHVKGVAVVAKLRH